MIIRTVIAFPLRLALKDKARGEDNSMPYSFFVRGCLKTTW